MRGPSGHTTMCAWCGRLITFARGTGNVYAAISTSRGNLCVVWSLAPEPVGGCYKALRAERALAQRGSIGRSW